MIDEERARELNEFVVHCYVGGGFNDRVAADKRTLKLIEDARAEGKALGLGEAYLAISRIEDREGELGFGQGLEAARVCLRDLRYPPEKRYPPEPKKEAR